MRFRLVTNTSLKRIASGGWHLAQTIKPVPRLTHVLTQPRQLFHQDTNKTPSSSQIRTYSDTTQGSAEHDYIIDPITNRRVPKVTYGTAEIPTSSSVHTASLNYGTDPSLFPDASVAEPHHPDGPPPGDELKKYGDVSIDSVEPADFSDPGPTLFTFDSAENKYSFTPTANEEYSLNHLPAEEEEFPLQEGELDKYKAEVDDIDDGTVAKQSYDDLSEYKPVFNNEVAETTEAPAYGDLGEYKPYYSNEGAEVKQVPAYKDLGEYGPYRHNEGVIADAEAAAPSDLDQYHPYMYKESERDVEAVETLAAEDLAQYKPQVFDDFLDATIAGDKPFQQYGDLDKYIAFRDQTLEGEPAAEKDDVADCLEEYEAQDHENVVAVGDGVDLARKMGNLSVEETEPVCVFDSTIHGVATDPPKRPAVFPEEPGLPIQPHHNVHIDPSQMSSMTREYIRDFPEQFAQPCNAQETLEAYSTQTTQDEEAAFAAQLNAASTMPIYAPSPALPQKSAPRLETSLNHRSTRRTSKVQPKKRPRLGIDSDSYSAEPQGLETSYLEECRDQPNGAIFVRTYGTHSRQDGKAAEQVIEPPPSRADDGVPYHRDPEIDGRGFLGGTSEPTAPKVNEPVVYRVLAYDPKTQSVSIAETTSDIPEQSTVSAPADILLRLSNPGKFFPYFASLQAEGFEIASGGGDVLVFRKVRATMRRVNPIDLMGTPMALPNAAAFASPTGFVNYDMPKADETETATQSAQQSNSSRKKISLGKKALLAGTSVVGLTYATGVVSEYIARPKPKSGHS
ncbi:ESCRT-II complex subunit VPS36 [Microdochium nivale]|nr:ESCRT-II complex subunit VPS36 [Microdochium nivale]